MGEDLDGLAAEQQRRNAASTMRGQLAGDIFITETGFEVAAAA